MMNPGYPQPSHINSREYQWVFDHYDKLVKKYPNEWIAFQAGKVVAHGNDPISVRRRANRLLKQPQEVPTFFLEKGIHIYFI